MHVVNRVSGVRQLKYPCLMLELQHSCVGRCSNVAKDKVPSASVVSSVGDGQASEVFGLNWMARGHQNSSCMVETRAYLEGLRLQIAN